MKIVVNCNNPAALSYAERSIKSFLDEVDKDLFMWSRHDKRSRFWCTAWYPNGDYSKELCQVTIWGSPDKLRVTAHMFEPKGLTE